MNNTLINLFEFLGRGFFMIFVLSVVKVSGEASFIQLFSLIAAFCWCTIPVFRIFYYLGSGEAKA